MMDKWYTHMNNISVTCFERDLNIKAAVYLWFPSVCWSKQKGGGGEQVNNVSSANFVERKKKRKVKVLFAYKNSRAKSFFNVHSVNIVSSRVRFV